MKHVDSLSKSDIRMNSPWPSCIRWLTVLSPQITLLYSRPSTFKYCTCVIIIWYSHCLIMPMSSYNLVSGSQGSSLLFWKDSICRQIMNLIIIISITSMHLARIRPPQKNFFIYDSILPTHNFLIQNIIIFSNKFYFL